MSKLAMNLSAAVIALVVALPVQAQDTPDAGTVVATVNGTEITLGHMLMVRAGLPEQYQQLPTDVLWDGIMNQLVQQEVLSQSDDAKETFRVRVAIENERRALLASEALAALAQQPVSDEALQAAYEAKYASADMGKEFNASHILVETEEEAAALVAELEGGADFAELAKEKSTGPSGPNGGELGWFGPGMMVAPFQAAVEKMEIGAVSAPVETQFGWHVIKLNESREMDAPTLDSVRDELTGEVQQQVVADLITSLTEEATVTQLAKDEIDTNVLQNLDLLEN
ncbi:peptidylprolyl isomerase [Puniceibacterium sp. IMCC21224]|uniref:peptidylprolyl isomerase n=1 Tax=Puniceibacterium sp. IMCC21224 TaxID=1618204 RepID=UPI00064D82A4|nr:peptidylprolyl isomerase [Puniceibacterium sp. IMCC21224]KMK65940.1 parvulin-like peptidyl-prolyl isomerase [Puniceibacterium sp. IMCC21224]